MKQYLQPRKLILYGICLGKTSLSDLFQQFRMYCIVRVPRQEIENLWSVFFPGFFKIENHKIPQFFQRYCDFSRFPRSSGNPVVRNYKLFFIRWDRKPTTLNVPNPRVVRVVVLLTGHNTDTLDDGFDALIPVILAQLCVSFLLQQHREHFLRNL